MSIQDELSQLGWPRRILAGTASITASIIWTHMLAGASRLLGPADAPLVALPLTMAATLLALLGVVAWSSSRSLPIVVAGAASAAMALELTAPGSWASALALLPATAAASELGRHLATRLPSRLDGSLWRRRGSAVLWLALATFAVFQVGRLATFVTDPESDWFLTTRNPFWAKHECLPAYIYGAELSERGVDNLYDPAHYPALNPQAEAVTTLEGMTPEDPYQYTPQFLLLPRLAISLTRHYPTIRSVWFGLQATLFLSVAGWLTLWVGGRHGRLAALLLPLALSAFPTLHALQYGQFHLAAITLAVASLLAFETRLRSLGGAFLAMATLAKIFPGLLFVVLAVQRRWRDLAWSAGFLAAITVVAWIVLGPAPFVAFFEHHLPRLASGEAFAFGDVWPEIRTLIIADNQGAFGLVEKLQALGVPGLDRTAAVRAGKLFGLGVLALTVLFARREAQASRDLRAAGWLALLGLGSMTSTGAFGDYVPLTATWLMTLLAARMMRGWRVALPLAACWLFQYSLLGTSPLGAWFSPLVMIPLSAISVLMMLALYGWTLVGAPAGDRSWSIQLTHDEVMAELDGGLLAWQPVPARIAGPTDPRERRR